MITSHRSIFAVWCCALRSTCDLVIGLTVNECVSVCVRVCLCCRPGCVWSLWECPAWIRPRGEGTTRPSWSSSSRSSTPESNACPSVTFISKKGAAVSGPPRLTCVFLFQSQTIPYSLTLWRVYRCEDSFYKLISQNEMEDKKTVGVSASYCIILVFPSSL